MQQNDSDVSNYQFNLHGCIVFDDFIPVSFCPSKGLLGNLAILPKVLLLEDQDQAKVSTELWLEKAQEIVDKHSEPSVCVLELAFPEEYYEALRPLVAHKDRKEKIRVAWDEVKTSLVLLAQQALESRTKRAEITQVTPPDSENPKYEQKKSSSSSAPSTLYSWICSAKRNFLKASTLTKENEENEENECGFKGKVIEDTQRNENNEGSDEESVTNDEKLQEFSDVDVSEDIEHAVQFFQKLNEQIDPPAHSPNLSAWLESLMLFLKSIEKLVKCCGLVVLMSCLRDPSTLSVPSHLPKMFREELAVPVVIQNLSPVNLRVTLQLCEKGNVNRAGITPIPLKPGDHVYRQMRAKGALRFIQHHGIYTGNGRWIHFSGNEMSFKGLLGQQTQARIRSGSLLHFLRDGTRVKIRKYKRCDPSETVVTRAEEALVNQTFPTYNLLRNNCEHFCYYCKTGKTRSKQVEKGIHAIAITTAVVAAVAGVAIASSRSRNN